MKIPYDMIKELAAATARWQLREICSKYGFEVKLPKDWDSLTELDIQLPEDDYIEQNSEIRVMKRRLP